jgi:hypothetical protein
MKKQINLTIILVMIFFASCATANKPGVEQYTPVPANHIYSNQYPFSMDGNIILKRDSGFVGSALSAVIFINNEKIVQFSQGQYYRLFLPNGVYFLSLKSGEGVNLGTPFERTIKLEINDQSRVITIRIFSMPTQGMVMEEVYE